MTHALSLEHVTHRFGDLEAVSNLSLTVDAGELVCLLGPSGCGKTTALRLAAGLEELQAGRITVEDRLVAEDGRALPPEQRSIGLVFQDFALFPHLSVAENVAFGLRAMNPAERRERVAAVLAQVGMEGYLDAFPHMLSGGQQQRVALARALAPSPRVMLLDEPFSGLDASLRNQVRDQTLHVLKRSGAATLMVTHDPEEAMFMADRIALMRKGHLVQLGNPTELYTRPANAFVAAFFGDINSLRGTVASGRVETPFGEVAAGDLPEGTAVDVLIRPEALILQPLGTSPKASRRPARVMASRLLGRSSLVHLSLDGNGREGAGGGTASEIHLHARIPGRFLPAENELLEVHLDHSQTFVFLADRVE